MVIKMNELKKEIISEVEFRDTMEVLGSTKRGPTWYHDEIPNLLGDEIYLTFIKATYDFNMGTVEALQHIVREWLIEQEYLKE